MAFTITTYFEIPLEAAHAFVGLHFYRHYWQANRRLLILERNSRISDLLNHRDGCRRHPASLRASGRGWQCGRRAEVLDEEARAIFTSAHRRGATLRYDRANLAPFGSASAHDQSITCPVFVRQHHPCKADVHQPDPLEALHIP